MSKIDNQSIKICINNWLHDSSELNQPYSQFFQSAEIELYVLHIGLSIQLTIVRKKSWNELDWFLKGCFHTMITLVQQVAVYSNIVHPP